MIHDEFYAAAFRNKLYNNFNELQKDLDNWIYWYDHELIHSGKYCYGKTPIDIFKESLTLAKAKKRGNNIQTTIEQNNIVCQIM